MNSIKFCRCDDRLIHGQTIFRWISNLGSKSIIIIDNDIQKDSVEQMLIQMSKPKNIELNIINVLQARQMLHSNDFDESLVIVKNLGTINELNSQSVGIKYLNIGRIPTGVGKEKITNTTYLNNNEKDILISLLDKECIIDIQSVPDDKKIILTKESFI